MSLVWPPSIQMFSPVMAFSSFSEQGLLSVVLGRLFTVGASLAAEHRVPGLQ